MKKLVMMRGLSGSGKSTMARKFLDEATYLDAGDKAIFSTDDYYTGDVGLYVFVPALIGKAHAWNQQRCNAAMYDGVSLIIIDNTNTQQWEMKPYLALAEKYGYEVEYLIPTTEWAWDVDECARRNTHGVPRDAIQRMKDRFEK